MAHANARLNLHGRRLLIARTTGPDAQPVAHVADQMGISRACAYKWKRRHDAEGDAGLADRSSRPHSSPRRTPDDVEAAIVAERRETRHGQVQIGAALGVPASTVAAVLRRHRVSRVCDLDLLTGATVREPVRRYEKSTPGELVHIDIKKFGKIRPGGGWAVHGRGSTQDLAKKKAVRTGYDFVHNAVDDYSRLTYSEVHTDEKKETSIGFFTRALAFFKLHDVTVTAVLTDNGSGYRSNAFATALADADVKHRRTRPYRPQTNGKVERFNRTLKLEWAYAKEYDSSAERTAALVSYLHHFNHHRGHSALKGRPPVTRVTKVTACNT